MLLPKMMSGRKQRNATVFLQWMRLLAVRFHFSSEPSPMPPAATSIGSVILTCMIDMGYSVLLLFFLFINFTSSFLPCSSICLMRLRGRIIKVVLTVLSFPRNHEFVEMKTYSTNLQKNNVSYFLTDYCFWTCFDVPHFLWCKTLNYPWIRRVDSLFVLMWILCCSKCEGRYNKRISEGGRILSWLRRSKWSCTCSCEDIRLSQSGRRSRNQAG